MSNDISAVTTPFRSPTPASAEPDPQISLPGSLRDALRALAAELTAVGWASRVKTWPACLHASNPEPGAAALSEDIYARTRGSGQWEYWWPWGEPISADPAEAAAIIIHVLRPAERHDRAGPSRRDTAKSLREAVTCGVVVADDVPGVAAGGGRYPGGTMEVLTLAIFRHEGRPPADAIFAYSGCPQPVPA